MATRPAVPRTRAGAAWISVAFGLLFLVVILVFMLQNLRDVRVSFFTAHWSIPLAIDLLLAATLGGLIVLLLGAVRILQLRVLARRHARATEQATTAAQGEASPRA
jgi:uncharacterized integral membrane protein